MGDVMAVTTPLAPAREGEHGYTKERSCMSKQQLSDTSGGHGKSPLAHITLTDTEMQQLLKNFLADKTEVCEDDVLMLAYWAETMRRGAHALRLVLDGTLHPVVQGREVMLLPRMRAGDDTSDE
jgi:hypothetical protein